MSSLLNIAQIVLIDLSLAGDNALVVGMAAAALPVAQRRQAMVAGIGAAALLRVVMAIFAVRLLSITGLPVAGGLLLVWVAWKMARELHLKKDDPQETAAQSSSNKLSMAIWQIIIADISMSLDNVLAVAGVARSDMPALIGGLGLSVALMALASTQIARLTERYPKLVYLGVTIILYTAIKMIYDGAEEMLHPIHALA